MGLKYESGESAKIMNTLTSNLDAAVSAMDALKSGSCRLTKAVDGRTLSGAAYEAGRGLFEDLVIPTIERVQKALEEIRSELSAYRSADGIVSGEGYLDEDNLTEQIDIKKNLKSNMEDMADQFCRLAETSLEAATAERYYEYASDYEQMADSIQDDIYKLQDKIDKLHEFSYQVSGLFSDSLDELDIAMQSIMVLNETTVHANGTYVLPFGTDKTWFKEKKKGTDMPDQALRSILGLEDDAIAQLGLTREQKDWYERAKRLMAVNPTKALDMLYDDADALWDIVNRISTKYPKAADKFLDGLAALEKAGNTKVSKLLSTGMEKFKNATSPVKWMLSDKLKLGEKLADTKFVKALGKGVKLGEKANILFTAADLGVRGISQGITDGIKEKSVGKGVISGGIEVVKSIGPLEGMAIGSCLGPAGTVIGGAVGLINWVVQMADPHLYNDIKEGAYKLYDGAVADIKNMGKAVSQGVESIKHTAGNFMKYMVEATPKLPQFALGW